MNRKIIVVDNFYENPDSIRKIALSSNYKNQISDKVYFSDEILSKVKILLRLENLFYNESSCGRFRVFCENNVDKINVDFESDWTGVVFLNLEKNLIHNAGLSFYKNKKFKIERCPNILESTCFGFTCFEELNKCLLNQIKSEDDQWFSYFNVPIVYNRLVLFRSKLWFSFTENFGNNPETAKLIHSFSFTN